MKARLAFAVAMLALLGLPSCASGVAFPYRRCLFSSVGGHELYYVGSVIARRDDDDALLFRYDDPTAGDHGFAWIAAERQISLRPCAAATLFDPTRIEQAEIGAHP